MALSDELASTYKRARSAGLDDAAALATVANRHMLPTLRAQIASANNDRAAIRAALDEMDGTFRTFAASVGVPMGWWRALLADSYPEVAVLWEDGDGA